MLETHYMSEYNSGMSKQFYKFIKENEVETTKAFLNDLFEHTTSWAKPMDDKLQRMENVLDYFAEHIYGRDELIADDVVEMKNIIHKYDEDFHKKGKK